MFNAGTTAGLLDSSMSPISVVKVREECLRMQDAREGTGTWHGMKEEVGLVRRWGFQPHKGADALPQKGLEG